MFRWEAQGSRRYFGYPESELEECGRRLVRDAAVFRHMSPTFNRYVGEHARAGEQHRLRP